MESTDTRVERLETMLRVGIVTSVDSGARTARVCFKDLDNLPSGELKILHQGTRWLPDIGAAALCLMYPRSKSRGSGFIIGLI